MHQLLGRAGLPSGWSSEIEEMQRRGQSAPPFTINGRFLTQGVTGVQRYALEITREIDRLLGDTERQVELAVPGGTVLEQSFGRIRTRVAPRLRGHAWEQLTLPRSHAGPLLNLCNLAPLLAKRSVVCIHDANVYVTPESYSRSFRLAYRFLLPRLARRAARVATVSRHAARELEQRLGMAERSIAVLPNGHEHALRWRADKSAFARDRSSQPPYVLAVGSLAHHKNLSRIYGLASALSRFGLALVVAGSKLGPFATTARFESSNITFLGRVTDDDLACLMDNALCLAFPSLQEGFGLPVIEAMARGCPVVASTASCLPEICGTAALMADPGCDDDWLRHFESLMRSKDLRDDLKARGQINARRYSWSRSAAGYLDLMAHA